MIEWYLSDFGNESPSDVASKAKIPSSTCERPVKIRTRKYCDSPIWTKGKKKVKHIIM